MNKKMVSLKKSIGNRGINILDQRKIKSTADNNDNCPNSPFAL
jgi:hypothetical protein